MSRFKAADIKVAIDDFGTQSSSIANLQNLQVSELKLDPTFTANIENNHKTRSIIPVSYTHLDVYKRQGLGSQLFFALPNGREQEREADKIGLELAARAGYNPDAAVTLWQKMAAQSKSAPPEFFSTHPASENRIAELKALAPKVRPLYEAAKTAK